MAFRISHLFTIFVLLAACFMLGDAAKSMNMPRAVQQNGAASFDQKVQALRKLAAAEQGATRDLIESLDDLDDLELTQLRIPKRALASEGEVPVYGGARRSVLGTYPARRGLMAYP